MAMFPCAVQNTKGQSPSIEMNDISNETDILKMFISSIQSPSIVLFKPLLERLFISSKKRGSVVLSYQFWAYLSSTQNISNMEK
jgi:hypothetical protein